jgi:cytochrome c oxidase subunit 2
MNFGETARKRLHFPLLLIAALALASAPNFANAQATDARDPGTQQGGALPAGSAPPPSNSSAAAPAADAQSPNVNAAAAPDEAVAQPGNAVEAAPGSAAYTPLGPEWIKGAPKEGAFGFQPQYSDDGKYALWMHNGVLMPVITAICLLVLALLLWVIVRFNRRSSPVPSKTSHNTLVEVLWTVIPALVLVAIAFPSMILLNRQYKSAPADALTVKATGYQWYWGFSYPDNGGFEVISNMKDEGLALAGGEPPQLAADNRMVVPVGEPIRLQTTGSDVIHAFGVPSLWFKLDAVPGRINERVLTITEPGIYYGQCMELCGARHAYMPIAIEAVPRPQFEAWVRSQGGTVGNEAAAPAPTPSAAPSQEPESSVEGAPGAGAAPTEQTAPGTPAPAA